MSLEIDAVLSYDKILPPETIEQFINKDGKILWVENPKNTDETVKHAKAAGISVITDKNIYQEAVRIRGNGSGSVLVEA